MRGTRVIITAGVVGAIAGILAGPSPAAADTPGFAFESPALPQVSPSRAVTLNATSCAAGVCVAVGGFVGQAAAEHPLVLMNTDGTWTQVPSANPAGLAGSELTGVSCAAANACAAVGFAYTGGNYKKHASLAEIWDGSAWTATPTPNPGAANGTDLAAVSCVSATNCTAVGSYGPNTRQKTLILRWDGTTWRTIGSPNPGADNNLTAVSCTTAAACTAVGSTAAAGGAAQTLVERWNGTAWATVSSPNPETINTLHAVSCPAIDSCVAVGVSDRADAIALAWDGSFWTSYPVPIPGQGAELDGVTCTAVDACTAVGWIEQPTVVAALIEAWDGTAWTVVATPSTARYISGLRGVVCPSATACFAVGDTHIKANRQLLMLAGNGTTWNSVDPVSPNGASPAELLGVSCLNAHFCMAVGASGRGPTAEVWDGHGWTAIDVPADVAYFRDVSCVSTTFCMAVGSDTEFWNGVGWTPAPIGGNDNFYGVSCVSASFCMAVGGTTIERWDGSTWTATPSGSPPGRFTRVSCASMSLCGAVGYELGPHVDIWDGSTWSIVQPVGSGAFYGVSCVGTGCTVVGTQAGSAGPATLAVRWNATTWTVPDTPSPGRLGAYLTGVSCTRAAFCTAVGLTRPTRLGQEALALTWDGSQWTQVPAVNGGGEDTYFSDVSCTFFGGCTAVGHRTSGLLTGFVAMGLIEGNHPE